MTAQQKCFVIMPFDGFDDVLAAIQSSVELADSNLDCVRLDDIKAAGVITEDLVQEIRESAFCIADITGSSPNVMWESGYALALGKPVILISQTKEDTPFDLRGMRVIGYSREDLQGSLIAPLAQALGETRERFKRAGANPIAFLSGEWYGYYLILRSGTDYLGKERYEISVLNEKRLELLAESLDFDQNYKGIVSPAEGFVLVEMSPTRHLEKVFMRFKRPIPGNDAVLVGVWSALDFDGKAAVGPILLSRSQMEEEDARKLFSTKFDYTEFGLRVP